MILLVVIMGLGFGPVLIALVVLVIPPILTSTYAGIRAVDPAAIDAAQGHGHAAAAGAVQGRGADRAAV